ncbi:MAG: hypothetical protein PHG79_04430 [Methanosarcina sp.]|nr:hypothetical protein [Methanosarcina sp.]
MCLIKTPLATAWSTGATVVFDQNSPGNGVVNRRNGCGATVVAQPFSKKA